MSSFPFGGRAGWGSKTNYFLTHNLIKMKEHKVGIIMNGVTGRMGTNQHLLRSIAEIIKQGGVSVGSGEVIMPDPTLVGRDEIKLKKLCDLTGIKKMSTNLDEVLKDPGNTIYFDAQTTGRRADAVRKAVKAGKHIYCEKPVAIQYGCCHGALSIVQEGRA